MTQNRKIAITGGIGSGKSAVCAILAEKGFPVYSCDQIYFELCGEKDFLERIQLLFPGCVKEGTLDRKAVSKKVFSDRSALEKLNALTHPLIMDRLFKKMDAHRLSFAEVPLLFESKQETRFDDIIVVLRNVTSRIEDIKRRDGLTEEMILSRIQNQYDYKSLPNRCKILINDGNLDELKFKIEMILSEI